MIDLAFVESLIRALDQSSLDNLELERGGTRVRLSKSPCGQHAATQLHSALPTLQPLSAVFPSGGGNPWPAQAGGEVRGEVEEQGQEEEGRFLEVVSPMVGTFYSAPAPDAAPYVQVGQRVGKGTVLCIIEAMKLMNELESEVEGTIARVMVENAQPVEYGQVLFLIEPS